MKKCFKVGRWLLPCLFRVGKRAWKPGRCHWVWGKLCKSLYLKMYHKHGVCLSRLEYHLAFHLSGCCVRNFRILLENRWEKHWGEKLKEKNRKAQYGYFILWGEATLPDDTLRIDKKTGARIPKISREDEMARFEADACVCDFQLLVSWGLPRQALGTWLTISRGSLRLLWREVVEMERGRLAFFYYILSKKKRIWVWAILCYLFS